jgi:hypothetical protein
MAIGLTIVGASITAIFSLEMRQCTNELGSELGKEKITAMTKAGEVYMRLYKNRDGIYIDKYENDILIEQGVKIGSAKVSVQYYSASNAAGTSLDENGIIIAFNKYDGSFKKIGAAWELYNSPPAPLYLDEYYSKLVVSSGKSSRTIELWPNTGKFSISG